jgi:hypothetical protein
MRFFIALCFLASVALSRPAHAQAARRDSADCVARLAASEGGKTTAIDAARLLADNKMPGLPRGEPSRFVVSVVVDALGRADSTTIQLPSELDSYSANVIRAVVPGWRFSPARIGTCPVRQVVRLTLQRQ